MPSDPNSNGWGEWSKHVLLELERLNRCYEDLRVDVQKIHIELAQLKVKAGLWGGVAGAIPAITAVLFILLRGN